jgi:hypothetical protein
MASSRRRRTRRGNTGAASRVWTACPRPPPTWRRTRVRGRGGPLRRASRALAPRGRPGRPRAALASPTRRHTRRPQAQRAVRQVHLENRALQRDQQAGAAQRAVRRGGLQVVSAAAAWAGAAPAAPAAAASRRAAGAPPARRRRAAAAASACAPDACGRMARARRGAPSARAAAPAAARLALPGGACGVWCRPLEPWLTAPRRPTPPPQVHPRVPPGLRRLQPPLAVPVRRGLRQAAAG